MATMAFKRKRSASELTTLFNSPARSDSSVESFDFPISPSLAFPRAFATPSHLSSRTMKRFRNNRPSEEEVHQRTLKMLYSAQQQTQNPVEEPAPAPAPAPAARNTQKSLHSFWNISSAAPALSRTASPPVDQMVLNPTSCDDCGVGLGSSGDADGMDVDGDDGSCGACGKHVCSHCSITNLGEQRRCLNCAERKTWAATGSAPGWASLSMRMF